MLTLCQPDNVYKVNNVNDVDNVGVGEAIRNNNLDGFCGNTAIQNW